MLDHTSSTSSHLGEIPIVSLQVPPVPQTPPSRAKQRVLHVINGQHYAGAERVQDLLALQLPQLGFEVGFACVKPDRFPEVRQAQKTRLYKIPMRGRFDFGCARRLAELIRAEDYALVHAHTPRSVLVGSLVAK